MRLLLLLVPLLFFTAGCYENKEGCLDPDAINFDVGADEDCPDGCCEYPELRLEATSFWGDTTLAAARLLADGEGTPFDLVQFRFYLSDLRIATVTGELPVDNPVETAVLVGTDTVITEVNANLVLLGSNRGSAQTAGSFRAGSGALTQVRGLYGMSDVFPVVHPPDAPAGSPLSTQPGLLNYNDGNGYLLGSLEVLLLPDSTARRIDLTGNHPLTLDFGGPTDPLRGFNLTVELAADYQALLGNLDLRTDSTLLAAEIRERLPDFLRVTGLR